MPRLADSTAGSDLAGAGSVIREAPSLPDDRLAGHFDDNGDEMAGK